MRRGGFGGGAVGHRCRVARLRRVDTSDPGLTRKRAGKGWSYADLDGERVPPGDTRDRIEALVIPPAWKDVWISPHENGHIQATGIDAAGRKQYLYHERWRTHRDREKFDHVLEFAACLPELRAVVLRHLSLDDLPRERALACAVRLLDLGFFRIGSEDYAEKNETYGVATLRKEHVTLEDRSVVFEYTAKSGKERVQVITDDHVLDAVGTMKRRRTGGDELLAYREGGEWVDVRSDQVNGYIKDHAGAFTAKDFRTWNATVLASIGLAMKAEPGASRTARRRAVTRTVKEVAFFLGNTPTVARSSYIDPRVIDRFNSGWTIAARVDELGGPEAFVDPEGRVALEDAVRDLVHDVGDESPALSRSGSESGRPM